METEKTTVTNHYYQGGINLIGCTMTNATFQTINQPASAAAPASTATASASTSTLPDSLATPAARDLLHRLTEAGLVDEAWQPINLSLARRGVLASLLAQKLDIAHTWKTFGTLWGDNPESLRRKFNEGMEQKRMGDFMAQITSLLE